MPCHAYTAEGVLLLARGEPLANRYQWARLSRPDVLFSRETPERLAGAVAERRRALGLRPGALQLGAGLATTLTLAAVPWGGDLASAASDPKGDRDQQPSLRDPNPDELDGAEPRVPFQEEIVAVRALRRDVVEQVGHVVEQV